MQNQNFTPNEARPEAQSQRFPFYTTPEPPPKPKPVFTARDTAFAYASLIVGYLFAIALPASKTPLGTLLAILLLYAFGAVYLRVNKFSPSVRSTVCGICFSLFSLSLITNGNGTVRFFACTVAICGFLFFLSDAAGALFGGLLSNDLLRHLKQATLSTPWSRPLAVFPALIPTKADGISKKIGKTALWILLGILLAAIPTAIIIALLSYDEQFMGLLEQIFSFEIDGIGELIADLAVALITAALVFGTLYTIKEKRNDPPSKSAPVNTHVLPRPLLCAAVTPILIVYVIFFISQKDYYLSALTSRLPQDLTFAEYARQGFFELCWVCAINALLLLLFNLLIVKREGGKNLLVRIYSSVISVFTLVLIATALSKMLLYIDAYGLTQKRVYTSWFMLLLAFAFIAVLIKQILARFPLLPTLAVGALLAFALIALPNVDKTIADYNVDRYLDGDSKTVDVHVLKELGSSSVPALTELEKALGSCGTATQTEDQRFLLNETKSVLDELDASLAEKESSLFSFNIPDAIARALLEERK